MPFYVAAPTTTIDLACPDGAAIPIEERAAAEVLTLRRPLDRSRRRRRAARRLRRDAGALHHRDRDGPRHLPGAVRREPRAGASGGPGRPCSACMLVLGIETSCDETSVAVLDGDGRDPAPTSCRRRCARTRRTAASCRRSRRARTSRTCPPPSRRRSPRRGGALEDVGARRGDGGAGTDRRAARRALGREGARLRARDSARRRSTTSRATSTRRSSRTAAARRARSSIPSTASSSRAATPSSCASSRTGSFRSPARATTRPGEAFDKVARRAGLGYPGGPVIDRIAATRRRRAAHSASPIGRAERRLARLLLFGPQDRDAAGARETRASTARRSTRTPSPRTWSTSSRPSSARSWTALLERVEAVHAARRDRLLALSGGVAANSELRATLAAWGESAGRRRCCCPSGR